tara:strand:+ start:774 stop:3962 length:3189 start_codon:yes stop_codon:yes gene_type:complete
MSRARVDQIVNQIGTGPVEFPKGLDVPSGETLRIGGPVNLFQNAAGSPGQIIKAGVNSELVWADGDTVSLSSGDGVSADRKTIKISQSGSSTQTEVILRAGSNVTLTRAVNEIRIDSSYVNTDTITRFQASGGSFVSGDVILNATGASTVSQNGQTITIDSTDTTYTAGTGVGLSGTEFSIGQAVGTSDTPTFDALTVTNQLSVGSISCGGNITGTWNGGTIPIGKGGTGNTTATNAFLALAPSVGSQTNRFLKTDGSSIFWSDLPASGGFTPKTYDLTGEDGGAVNQVKLRLTDNDGLYDDVVFVATDDITITRNSNTITIGSAFADTTLSTENVQDIVGAMIDNSLNTNITVTYDDANNKLLFSGSAGGGGADGDTTYDFDSSQITGGAGLRLVPGGTGTGDPIDIVKLVGGTNVTITRDSGTGDITFSSADTDQDTITRLQVAGPNTTGGSLTSGDITFQAGGTISLAQSGGTIAISASDSNSYVNNAYYNAVSGKLYIERSDSLADVEVPVDNLQSYFDTRYVTTGGLADAKITSANFSTSTGNLTLIPNDGTGSIVVNLDGRYVTNTGDNFYVNSGTFVQAANTLPGQHVNRQVLQLSRNDGNNVTIETEPFLDYIDTLYAPITATDTRVDAFTFSSGQLFLSVSNGDTYTHDLDSRYVKTNDYVEGATFNTSDGVLTFNYGHETPGVDSDRADITVDLDGRYKLDSAQDVQIQALSFNSTTGDLHASRNNGTNTAVQSLDGRYIDQVLFSNNVFTFKRTGGTDTTHSIPEGRVDIPDGTKILCYQPSAPTGYVKETTHNNKALRVVSGSGGGSGGENSFTSTFTQTVNTGGSVSVGNMGVTTNTTVNWDSGMNLGHNLNVNGNISADFDSSAGIGGSINLFGNPSCSFSGFNINRGNLYATGSGFYARAHALPGSQGAGHDHNYQAPAHYGNADWDDGTVIRGETTRVTSQPRQGQGAGHGHYIDGNSNLGGSPGYSGNVNANRGNMGIQHNLNVTGGITISEDLQVNGDININSAPNGSSTSNINGAPGYTAGNINLAVQYIDVIICRRDPSNAP